MHHLHLMQMHLKSSSCHDIIVPSATRNRSYSLVLSFVTAELMQSGACWDSYLLGTLPERLASPEKRSGPWKQDKTEAVRHTGLSTALHLTTTDTLDSAQPCI